MSRAADRTSYSDHYSPNSSLSTEPHLSEGAAERASNNNPALRLTSADRDEERARLSKSDLIADDVRGAREQRAQTENAARHQQLRNAGYEESARPAVAPLTSRIAQQHQEALQADALVFTGGSKRRTGRTEFDDFIEQHPHLAPAAARSELDAAALQKAAEAGRSSLESKSSLDAALNRLANHREGQAPAPELRQGDRSGNQAAAAGVLAGTTSAVVSGFEGAAPKPDSKTLEPQTEPESSGWFTSTLNEFVDAGKGLYKLCGDIGGWVGEKTVQGLKAAGRGIAYVATHPLEAAKSTWNGICWAAEKVWDGAVWLGETSWELTKMVGRSVLAAGRAAYELGGQLIGAAGSLCKTVWNTGSAAVSALRGDCSWSDVGAACMTGLKETKKFLVKAGELCVEAGKIALDCGVAVGKGAWGLVKGLSDALGVTDMVVGAYYLAKAQPQLISDLCRAAIGQGTFSEAFSNYGENMKGAGQCALGALKCLGQVTGVIDAYLCIKHSVGALAAYGRGDNVGAALQGGQAVMHGAFAALSFGTLCATVATLGAAGESMAAVAFGRATLKEAGKEVLTVASKEFLKTESKELAKLTIEKMAANAVEVVEKEIGEAALREIEEVALKQLGEEATEQAQQKLVEELALKLLLKREAETIALKGGEALAKEVAERGIEVLSEESIESLMKQISEESMQSLLTKLKMTEAVEQVVFSMLGDVSKGNVKKLSAELAKKGGISETRARVMVEGMRRSLKNPKFDAAMIDVIEESMTGEISAFFHAEMEAPFKETFKRALSGEVNQEWSKSLARAVGERAASLGIAAETLTERLVEAGWKGAREGITSAIRQSVREGAERAFKKFRQRSIRVGGSGGGETEEIKRGEGVESSSDVGDTVRPDLEQADGRFVGASERFRQKMTDLGDGHTRVSNLVFEPSLDEWIEVSSEVITTDEAKALAKKAA